MARITRIVLYPIKSLDGIGVAEARVSAQGALERDRRYAIVDEAGRFVNGKRLPDVHRLRARYDDAGSRVVLRTDREERAFDLDGERAALAAWLGAFFGFPVGIRDDPDSGFPDDREAYGPTIITTATLAAVAGWFPGRTEDQMRLRFRANLEIDEVPAFWEDRLYGEPGTTVCFRIGGVHVEGTNPCQRCVVPTRDPLTGSEDRGFQKTLAARRAETLPPWAARSRFDHYYRLAVNTRIAVSEAGKAIRVGDPVEIIGPGGVG
ncbi:MAG: MOSC domain-containing protein [Gammaproteobacteria bacterium]